MKLHNVYNTSRNYSKLFIINELIIIDYKNIFYINLGYSWNRYFLQVSLHSSTSNKTKKKPDLLKHFLYYALWCFQGVNWSELSKKELNTKNNAQMTMNMHHACLYSNGLTQHSFHTKIIIFISAVQC